MKSPVEDHEDVGGGAAGRNFLPLLLLQYFERNYMLYICASALLLFMDRSLPFVLILSLVVDKMAAAATSSCQRRLPAQQEKQGPRRWKKQPGRESEEALLLRVSPPLEMARVLRAAGKAKTARLSDEKGVQRGASKGEHQRRPVDRVCLLAVHREWYSVLRRCCCRLPPLSTYAPPSHGNIYTT